jgi:tetratricopeptide (TPR) repeat protein
LEPGNPENIGLAALSVAILGRLDEALLLTRRAVDLDPLNARSWKAVGEIEFRGGKLDEAEADLKKAHELRPDDFLSSMFLSEIYVMQGRPRHALPEIERVRYDRVRAFLYAIAYHALGREKESDTALRELIAKYRASDPYHQAIEPYLVAEIYAFRNQSVEAFAWLDRAYAKHDDDLIFTKVDPLLKSLHSDPRFAALLKKLNLPN